MLDGVNIIVRQDDDLHILDEKEDRDPLDVRESLVDVLGLLFRKVLPVIEQHQHGSAAERDGCRLKVQRTREHEIRCR